MTSPSRAIVTGGGSGLGAAFARHVTGHGGRAVALDLADTAGISTAPGARFSPCDVADPTAVASAIGAAAEWLDGIDALFLAAGALGAVAPIVQLEPEEWRHAISVNLDSAFYTLHAAVPHLREGGSVVAVCSVAGLTTFGTPGAAAYMVAKAGLAALVRVAALELAQRHIRVNAVAPGAVTDTRFVENAGGVRGVDDLAYERFAHVPLGGSTTSNDIVSLVAFLCSDAAARITGSVTVVDAGQGLLGSGRLKLSEA